MAVAISWRSSARPPPPSALTKTRGVGPVPPAFDVSVELDALLRQHNLTTEQLIGVHGRSGSYQELQASIALRKRP